MVQQEVGIAPTGNFSQKESPLRNVAGRPRSSRHASRIGFDGREITGKRRFPSGGIDKVQTGECLKITSHQSDGGQQ